MEMFPCFPTCCSGLACCSLSFSSSSGCGWAQGLGGAPGRTQFGEKLLKNGNSGDTRGKRKVKVCWSSLERGRGLFLGVKGKKGTFPCGFGASPVRDVEPGEAAGLCGAGAMLRDSASHAGKSLPAAPGTG